MGQFIVIYDNGKGVMTVDATQVTMINRMSAGDFYSYNEEEMDAADVRSYDTMTIFHMKDGTTRTVTTDCQIVCK